MKDKDHKITAVERDEFIPTRDTLLVRLKDWDDNESWKEFFDIYWRLIYRTAMKAGLSDAEARDVVQETVIGVCRNIPDFQYDPEKGSFKTWLKNQTDWRIKDHLRKRWSRRSLEEDPVIVAEGLVNPASLDPSRHWDDDWERNLLMVAMERVKAKVDPKILQTFELYVVDELPIEKVTALLGVTRTYVYVCKHRVTALLRQETRKLKKQTSSALPRCRGKSAT